MAVGELCTEILHVQKFEQSYFTGYYVTYCLRSPQLARGTEQTAQCQFTGPFFRAAIGKGSGYARLIMQYQSIHGKDRQQHTWAIKEKGIANK